ncbi:MAG: DUF4118 domain-containing protein [Gammaproteobacteria bacterium]
MNLRADPDHLLRQVVEDESRRGKGHLKVFLGASAGVGKTYAMLQAAHFIQNTGRQVLIGVIETHGRKDTEALLAGLQRVPMKQVNIGSVSQHEFDLDSALEAHPDLILIDELAHHNGPASRHLKRWQDVQDLLDAGIDVFTTLNIQHIESLNDIVAQITGIKVRETIPDAMIEHAHEIELIDLPPDELLKRLAEGKVYIREQAEQATRNFFRRGNLIALRELVLRYAADRIDADMRQYREYHSIEEIWPVRERVMVCIPTGAVGERLIRVGKRMTDALRAEWIVVHIETIKNERLPPREQQFLRRLFRLAERLGAEMVSIPGGRHFSTEVLTYARVRNVTQIVLGKPRRQGWRRWLFGSVVDAIVQGSGTIGIHVVSTETPHSHLSQKTRKRSGVTHATKESHSPSLPRSYIGAFALISIATLIAWFFYGQVNLSNLVMVYFLAILATAVYFGRGPSILASVIGVVVFDFFFVPPLFSFAVSDAQYLITFSMMLLVGFVASQLVVAVRGQAERSVLRERRMASLYTLSQALASTRNQNDVLRTAIRHLSQEVGGLVAFMAAVPDSSKVTLCDVDELGALSDPDLALAQWVYDHHQDAGLGTDTLPGSSALYIPFGDAKSAIVMAVRPVQSSVGFDPEQRRMLQTYGSQIAMALERVRLAREAESSRFEAEAQKVKNSLLSSISHDIRTPLASIIGAAEILREPQPTLGEATRLQLAQDIQTQARRMSVLAENILEMARWQSGAVDLHRQWYPLEEIIGRALDRVKEGLQKHPVQTDLPEKLLWVQVDGGLFEQVFNNLFENVIRHTPDGTPFGIRAYRTPGTVVMEVADYGPGLPKALGEKIFDTFVQGRPEQTSGGVGLGLAIVQSIIQAHGGSITAKTQAVGGALFRIELPMPDPPTFPEDPNS